MGPKPVARRDTAEASVTIRRYYPLVGITVGLCLAFLAYYHYQQLSIPLWRTPVIILSFLWMTFTLGAAHFNHPYTGQTPALRVAVVIANHNEDPKMLRAMLDSMDNQTVLPYCLYLIENGDTDGSAKRVFDEWSRQTSICHTHFRHRVIAGKREAQVVAFSQESDADVFLTVDGDTRLDPFAIENGLKPFNDDSVMSVAGLLVGQNRTGNLLTQIVDLGFVSSFMNGRAAWSRLRSVAVNCGGLAFYRSWVVKKHLEEYRNQTVWGKKAVSGDDRILTCLSALEGKTVFQESSVAYTLLPNNMGHLTRQRGRWWRSFWWGGIWLIRRFPINRTIWWLVVSQYVTFVLYTVVFPFVLIVDPIVDRKVPWMFFVYITGLSYLRSARTLSVRRPDQSLVNQCITFVFISPLVTVLNLWLCTVLQWWGLVTFSDTGWRTRQKVEVSMQS